MKIRLYRMLLGILLLAVSCLACAVTVQDTVTDAYTLKQLGLDSSVTLNGYKPSKTLYIPIPPGVNVQSLKLHLKLYFSEALADGSQVELRFNQLLVRRLGLATDGTRESSMDIELPLTQLSNDWQQLQFSATLFSARNLCDPNVWIYIDPESTITATWTRSTFSGLLNQLPSPFVSSATLHPIPVLALLPGNPTQPELFSLLQVVMYLGSVSPDAKVRLSTGFVNQTGALENTHQLLLTGLSESLFRADAPWQSFWLQNQTIQKTRDSLTTPNTGALTLVPSPFNPLLGMLVVTGNSPEGLQKAAQALLMPEFVRLVAGNTTLVSKAMRPDTEAPSGSDYEKSFAALGYEDRSVSGAGRHVLGYTLTLPNNRVPQSATLKTYITSPVLEQDEDYSLVTLVVNGARQAAFRLRNNYSAWEATLRADALKPGKNRIEYRIDLHRNNEQCTRQAQEEKWATIHAQTTFETSFTDELPQAMLNQFPVPFGDDIAVVIPDDFPRQMIDALARLMYKMGQLFAPVLPHFSFHTAGTVDEAFIRGHNIVLLGTPSNNRWVRLLFDYLPIQLGPDARHFAVKQSQLNLEMSEQAGLLALLSSPWKKNTAILMITGDSETSFFRALGAFTKDRVRMGLDGNIAIVNDDQSVRLFNSYDNRYAGLKDRVEMSLSNSAKNLFYYLRHYPQTLIYVLVVLIPLVLYLRRRKK